MYIKKIAALWAILFFVVHLHGKNHAKPFDPNSHPAVKLTINLWHEDKFNEEKYSKIIKKFWDLVKVCEENEKVDGIHGSINISFEPIKI